MEPLGIFRANDVSRRVRTCRLRLPTMARKAVPAATDRLSSSRRSASPASSDPMSRDRTASLLKQLREAGHQARVLKARVEDLQEQARLRDQARTNRPIRKPRS